MMKYYEHHHIHSSFIYFYYISAKVINHPERINLKKTLYSGPNRPKAMAKPPEQPHPITSGGIEMELLLSALRSSHSELFSLITITSYLGSRHLTHPPFHSILNSTP